MESGAPKRDTPDDEDFEGEGRESDQLPEEAPREVRRGTGRREKGEGEREAGRQRGERGERR